MVYVNIVPTYKGTDIYTNLPLSYNTQNVITFRNRTNGNYYLFYTENDYTSNSLRITKYNYGTINIIDRTTTPVL